MLVDVNAFLGARPWHPIPGGTPGELLAAMDRTGIDQAWLSHLGGMYAEDPSSANRELYDAAEREPRFRAVPSVHPWRDGWEAGLDEAVQRGVPAVRADPTLHGQAPDGDAMRVLVAAAAERGVPLMLSVRLEDIRQRDPADTAPELEPWAVRALIRMDPRLELIVTHADRDFIEQVHFGSTPSEAGRIRWDICWVWGPPEDHLAILYRTVGEERFVFGTGMPARIPEAAVAKIDLTR